MTTDQELRIDRLARQVGARILPDLGGELHPEDIAGWFPRSRRVLYRLGLSLPETICAIAHELGHAQHDDDYADDDHRDARQELRADRFAAGLLITPSEYKEAENLVGSHEGALAKELGVTVEYVHTWRVLYTRATA